MFFRFRRIPGHVRELMAGAPRVDWFAGTADGSPLTTRQLEKLHESPSLRAEIASIEKKIDERYRREQQDTGKTP